MPTDERPGRPAWFRLVGGVASVVIGVGLVLVGSASGDRTDVGGNVPVNEAASDPLEISAHNSPTLVRSPLDPQHLAVANRIDTPRFSCALHTSRDGGRTWQSRAIPFPAGEEQPPRCFSPDAAFTADGTLHLSFVTLKGLGNTPNAVWVVSSRRGEASFSDPVQVSGPSAFQVRLVADPSRARRLYVSWLQAKAPPAALGFSGPGNVVLVSRSDDAGATWGPSATVTPPGRARPLAPSPAVADGGQLYVLYLDVGDDVLDYQAGHEGRGGDPYPGRWGLILASSGDGGASWQETVVDGEVVPIDRVIAFFPPSPSLAVAPDGRRLYAAFHDGRLGDPDVLVWASADGGAHFAAPRRVNDTDEGDTTAQYLPEVAVAPGGRVDVVYYDRRGDPANRRNEVSLQSSHDDGAGFGARVRLSDQPFDSRIGFGSERDLPDLGSRLGLVSDDGRAVAAWADTRAGTVASNKQNIAVAVVTFSGSSAFGRLARYAAVAVGALGVLLLTAWAVATFRESSADQQQFFRQSMQR